MDLRTLFEWSGVVTDGGIRASLLDALGQPVVLRDPGGITAIEFETLVTGRLIPPLAIAQAVSGPAIIAIPLQRARARLVRCAARLKLGQVLLSGKRLCRRGGDPARLGYPAPDVQRVRDEPR